MAALVATMHMGHYETASFTPGVGWPPHHLGQAIPPCESSHHRRAIPPQTGHPTTDGPSHYRRAIPTHHIFEDEGEVGCCVDDVVQSDNVGMLEALQQRG